MTLTPLLALASCILFGIGGVLSRRGLQHANPLAEAGVSITVTTAVVWSLTLVSGPERLESGWWDGDDIARDYFVGRDASERCLWVFRTRAGEWFVHGVFG